MSSLTPSLAQEEPTSSDSFLDGRLTVLQPSKGFRSGSDAVFLAASCLATQNEHVLELGCGVGVASLCLALRTRSNVSGLEISKDYADLARENARQNSIPLNIVEGSVEDMPSDLKEMTFDHVICNPPFFKGGSAALDDGRCLSRQESVPLETWIEAGMKRVKPKGTFTIIHLAEKTGDILHHLYRVAGLIEIKPLAPRKNRSAGRVIIRARKGGHFQTELFASAILHENDTHESDAPDYSMLAEDVLRHAKALDF